MGYKYYKGKISPCDDTIFVFDSNIDGKHVVGRSKKALKHFEAIYGKAEGLYGYSYALPTLNYSDTPSQISIESITASVCRLYECAREHPDLKFKIANNNSFNECTLGGYSGDELLDVFINRCGEVPDNIFFSEVWYNNINNIREHLSTEEIEHELLKRFPHENFLQRVHDRLVDVDVIEWLKRLIKLEFVETASFHIAIEDEGVSIAVWSKERGKVERVSLRTDCFQTLLVNGKIFEINEGNYKYIQELDFLLTCIGNFNGTFDENVPGEVRRIIYRLYQVLSYEKYQYLYKDGYINLEDLEAKFNLPKDKVTDIVKSTVTKSFELNESEAAIRIRHNK